VLLHAKAVIAFLRDVSRRRHGSGKNAVRRDRRRAFKARTGLQINTRHRRNAGFCKCRR
jgi:hypothetical protein